ncbi:MAG: hypothetical protein F6K11_34880 [Leptolyngbya sp. SIO3F4]|nr:hypothetical protein [Leptolyngbya sp. SIO3F4]
MVVLSQSRLWSDLSQWQIALDEIICLNSSHNASGDSQIAVSPDGKYIATAGYDDTLRVWHVQTGKPVFIANHDDAVINVVFSSNGQYIATASFDNTVRVWDAKTGQATSIFYLHKHPTWVAFSPDNQSIAMADHNGVVQVHSLWSSNLAELICQRLGRNLTASEWEKYMQTELTKYNLTCSNLPIHRSVLDEAHETSKSGDTKQATKLYRRMAKILAKSKGEDVTIYSDGFEKLTLLENSPRTLAVKMRAVGSVQKAREMAKKGEFEKAISFYKKALEINPDIDLEPYTYSVKEQNPEAVIQAIVDAK